MSRWVLTCDRHPFGCPVQPQPPPQLQPSVGAYPYAQPYAPPYPITHYESAPQVGGWGSYEEINWLQVLATAVVGAVVSTLVGRAIR